MEEKLARIIGHLQFDGWVANKKYARTFFYGNSNLDLINEFVQDIKTVFGLSSFLKKDRDNMYRVYFHSAKIVRELNRITKYHSYTWSVPDFVLNGSETIKIGYLQAFFDDEGHVSKTHIGANYIVIRGTSMNEQGILGIRDLLLSIDIESNVRKFKSGDTSFSPDKPKYVLTITNFQNVLKFYNKITLASKTKQAKIGEFIKNHGKNVMQTQDKIQEVLDLKKYNGYGARRISKITNVPKGTVSHWLRGDRRVKNKV